MSFPSDNFSHCLQAFNTITSLVVTSTPNTKPGAVIQGRSLSNFITDKRSKIISPSSPTYRPTHANHHPDLIDFFFSDLLNHIHTNITNLNDPESDHTPAFLKIESNIIHQKMYKLEQIS